MDKVMYLNNYKTMSNERFIPIILTIRLKAKQKQEDNKWLMTLNNEQRLVTSSLVQTHFQDLLTAISSFKLDEIESYEIKYGNINIMNEF